jgi:hypothetical protein
VVVVVVMVVVVVVMVIKPATFYTQIFGKGNSVGSEK